MQSAGVNEASPFSDRFVIAVFGPNPHKKQPVPEELLSSAEAFGRGIARRGSALLTGGTGPDEGTVKGRAIRGVENAPDPHPSARWIGVNRSDWATAAEQVGNSVVVTPGWRHRRNFVEACLCDAAIAIEREGGTPGTASEILFCIYLKRPVVRLGIASPQSRPTPLRGMRDNAIQIIQMVDGPSQSLQAIDAAIQGAYRWVETSAAAADYDTAVDYSVLTDVDREVDAILDKLCERISSRAIRSHFGSLISEDSWNEFVAASVRAVGR